MKTTCYSHKLYNYKFSAEMKKHKLFTIRVTFLRRVVEGVNLKFKKYSGIVNLT